jgi:FKBP12-rapamycin complex-associated protein
MWSTRLQACQRHVDVWQDLLAVHALVVRPDEDTNTWLNFSSLCLKSGRLALSLKVLTQLIGHDPSLTPDVPLKCSDPSISLAYLTHLWTAGFQHDAFQRLAQVQHKNRFIIYYFFYFFQSFFASQNFI